MHDLPETSYAGHHAELYDLFYSDKPYAQEADFVHACIQTYGPGGHHLLELACGTGTHSLLLERHGYEIIATDYSNAMLSHARRKAKAAGSGIEFRPQDMRKLDVPERPFDAIICLFDSIGYVATNENLSRVLAGVHAHLKSGGVFIFEFWHAGAMLRGYDPLRIRRWRYATSEVLRISETSIDYERQLCRVAYTIYELDDNGSYTRLQEEQVNRFFLVQEMGAFLLDNGLVPLRWFSGFKSDENVSDQTWHIVGIARKPGDG